MAKQNGLGDSLLIDGYDLSGDIGAVQTISSRSGVLDMTAINASAKERILSHLDGELGFNAFFNKATSQEHLVLRARGSGANRVMTWLRGSTIGKAAYGIVAKQVNYDGNRATDGSLTFEVQGLGAAYGGEFADQLTAGLRTDTAATNGTSLNNGAATSKGVSAYLQVTAFSGTDVTMKIQSSSDNGSGDAFATITGGTFTQVTSAPTSERIVTSLTQAVEQYLRAITETSGGVTSVTFSIIVCRWPTQ